MFHALSHHPRALTKARAKIHTIIGQDRLQTPGDRSSLLYLEVVYREVMRRRPTVPMILRSAIDDDVLNGYFVPKGTYSFIRVLCN